MTTFDPAARFTTPADDEIAEVSLLLPVWQVHALESAAEAQGLTAGQLLRRVIAQVVDGTRAAGQECFLA